MEKYAIPNKLPSKQVNILAHRRKRINRDQGHINQKNSAFIRRKKNHLKPGFVKAEILVAAYRKAERDRMRIKRDAIRSNLKPRTFVPDAERKLALVFRHRGNVIASPEVIAILRDFRVARKYQAALVPLTPANVRLLAAAEPYITWGYPTYSTVRDLVFKYGFMRDERGRRQAIKSNTQVEEALGPDVICVEDIIHELFSVGPNFERVNRCISHFALQAPREGWEKSKGLHFAKGGEVGFRGEEINGFFKMLL